MTTTLLDYAQTEFPNHTLEVWNRDGWTVPSRDDSHRGSSTDTRAPGGTASPRLTPPPSQSPSQSPSPSPSQSPSQSQSALSLSLREHTVVAHVVGAQAALQLMDRLRAAGWNETTAVLVCPTPPTVLPQGGEDRDGVTDLPNRRVIGAAVMGAVIAGLLGATAGWIIGDEVATGLIFGGFSAVLGAVVGAMLGGLGRHAGERAWSQPNVPGRTMAVVATFASDDTAVAEVVTVMEAADPHDIRLLSASGSWRSPLI